MKGFFYKMSSNLEKNVQKNYKNYIWQPFTQMKLSGSPPLIKFAKGEYLYTYDKKEIIDAVGSWWVNVHGHNHPYINKKITKQMKRFEHVMFSGLIHEGAVEVARALAQSTKYNLPKVFFSDNGSSGVEIALKMAFQYFQNKNMKEKTSFITLESAYHGDTVGAMSVGASSFHSIFEKLFFPCYKITQPQAPFSDTLGKDSAETDPTLKNLEGTLHNHAQSICAIIVEPIVQAASGPFHFYSPDYLKKIKELCVKYEILMIADEVFTGCGRTGSFYACEHADLYPDIMVLSKGLSGGYLPFAATLSNEKVFEGFYSDDRNKAFLHGHSMTANPLACAAAQASLELFKKEERMKDVKELSKLYKEYLHYLSSHSKISEFILATNSLGAIATITLQPLGNNTSYTDDLPWKMMNAFIAKGVLIRPLGNVIYLTPPYNISKKAVEKIFSVIEDVLYDFYQSGRHREIYK